MAYLMVHLTIGNRILALCPEIKDEGAFLLGSIAPDAVMFRPGGTRADKTATHFCVGGEGWGFYTNYGEWTQSLWAHMARLRGTVGEDFLFGYAAHILTDIENTRLLWTPTRQTGDSAYVDTYLRDCEEVDSRLLHAMEDTDALWRTLEAANREGREGLFTRDDIAGMLGKMQREMYADRRPDPTYTLSIFTLEKAAWFMRRATKEILKYRALFAQ